MVTKQKKMIAIYFRRKDLYLLTAIFVFLIGAGAIIAYNPSGTGNPAILGHSANEVSGAVVGSCIYLCDWQTSTFYHCESQWGEGVCDGRTSFTGCVNPAWQDGGRCHCNKGNVVFVGADYSYGSESTQNYGISIQRKYLCITP